MSESFKDIPTGGGDYPLFKIKKPVVRFVEFNLSDTSNGSNGEQHMLSVTVEGVLPETIPLGDGLTELPFIDRKIKQVFFLPKTTFKSKNKEGVLDWDKAWKWLKALDSEMNLGLNIDTDPSIVEIEKIKTLVGKSVELSQIDSQLNKKERTNYYLGFVNKAMPKYDVAMAQQ